MTVREDEALTQKEFAVRLGVRPSYVTALKQRGRLVLTKDGRRVLYHASLERIRETRDPSKITPKPLHGDPAPEAAAALGYDSDGERQGSAETPREILDYQSARARREHYNAKMAELEYRKAIDQLVEIGLVREVILNATTTLRTQLEQMAERIAPRVLDAAGEVEVRAAILEEVEHALEDLACTFRRYAS